MPFTVDEFKDLVRILEAHPEWREELRRLLLTDELLRLPEIVCQLVEAQGRTERQLQVLAERVNVLTEQVGSLLDWQRGEAGRREGERYERQIIKRAPMLFNGGRGGATDTLIVQERLSEWLRPVLQGDKFLEPTDDPTLSDLIWWKEAKVLVVEISLKVNGHDVLRAHQRAQTLRLAGVDVTPVVIGEDWANLEVRELAKEKGVEWVVGNIPSEGMLTFRRLPMDMTEATEC
ncbi:MAG TPA: hypothetical protein EYP10_06050 [Armatimonadetes bacterium]|nr:hypothetical protein [Armatimonadota bacterium]